MLSIKRKDPIPDDLVQVSTASLWILPVIPSVQRS
jgi:hypothetical protein